MLADWNCPPSELRQQQWLQQLQAVVLEPRNATPTCWTSEEGSLIDYAVVSERLLPLLDLTSDGRVPWAPHEGLRLRVRHRIERWRVLRLRRPAPLPPSLLGPATQRQQASEATAWERAQAAAEQSVTQLVDGSTAIGRATQQLCVGFGSWHQARDTGLRLQRWANAWESLALERAGDSITPEEALRVRGRASHARLGLTPLVPSWRIEGQETPTSTSFPGFARVFETLRVLAERLELPKAQDEQRRADAPLPTRRRTAAAWAILRLARSTSPVVLGAWALFGTRMQATVLGHMSKAALNVLEGKRAIGLAQRAAALRDRAVHSYRGAREATLQAWAARAFESGARLAHRWTNAPNTARTSAAEPEGPQRLVTQAAAHWRTKWKALPQVVPTTAGEGPQRLRACFAGWAAIVRAGRQDQWNRATAGVKAVRDELQREQP